MRRVAFVARACSCGAPIRHKAPSAVLQAGETLNPGIFFVVPIETAINSVASVAVDVARTQCR